MLAEGHDRGGRERESRLRGPESMTIARSEPIGTFSLVIPLRHLFGFCEITTRSFTGLNSP